MIGLVFYFTATGNSLYAARQLDGECYSIPRELHGDMHYSSAEIGIVCPVYGHEMPLPVKRFIAEADFETDYLYLILTYGNRHGGAAELAADAFKNIYRITEKCIGCGICTKVCPMGCFELEAQRAVRRSKECISYMACIHACPETAIRLTVSEPNPNARYRNENVSFMDIITANRQK